jgi:hypothetical protein
MTSSGGLTHDAFAYFIQPPEKRDALTKEKIRDSLRLLLESVATGWQTNWYVHPGNIHDDDVGAWGVLAPGAEHGTHSSRPHLSIRIEPSQLEIFANVETKPPYEEFMQRWRRDPQGLIHILRSLSEIVKPERDLVDNPWRIAVNQRHYLNRPRKYLYWQSVDVALPACREWPDAYLRQFLTAALEPVGKHAAPEVKLVRSYPAHVAVRTGQLTRLVEDAIALEPFFEWLEVPGRPLQA